MDTRTVRAKSAAIIALAVAAIAATLGAAGGAEYTMRQWDAADARRIAKQAEIDGMRRKMDETRESTDQSLLSQIYQCQASFMTSTVLYEPSPGVQLSISLRGVGVAPSANQTPRWVIPARIKPQVVSGTPGGSYYYLTQDNRLDGPYVPEIHP